MPLMPCDLEEPLALMLQDGIKTGEITAKKNRKLSMIHINDAVEFLYKLLMAEEPERRVYNLTSGEEISESQIAYYLAEGLGGAVNVKEEEDEKRRTVLTMDRFKKEFGGKVFHNYKEELPLLAREVLAKEKVFFKDESEKDENNRGFMGKMKDFVKAILPYVETAILFIPAFMLNNRATGSDYFANLDFYLLYVFMFAIPFDNK